MENGEIKKIFEAFEEKNIGSNFIDTFWNKTLPTYKKKKRRKIFLYFSFLFFSLILIFSINQSRDITGDIFLFNNEKRIYKEDFTILKIYKESMKEEYPEIYNSSVWIDNDKLDEFVNILNGTKKEETHD